MWLAWALYFDVQPTQRTARQQAHTGSWRVYQTVSACYDLRFGAACIALDFLTAHRKSLCQFLFTINSSN